MTVSYTHLESVKQTAKDVSKQAAEVIQQTKEKVGSGEITTGTVLESVKELSLIHI